MQWLATLDAEHQAAVLDAMKNPDWTSAQLHAKLSEGLGYNRLSNVLRGHRRGSCSCGTGVIA